MNKISNDVIVCFDVDDTLIMWKGENYTADPKHVESLIRHAKRHHFVVVWSAGGVSWADQIVKELGLEPYVDQIMSKPRWYCDDKPADKWMERYYYDPKGRKESVNVGEHQECTGETRDNSIVSSRPLTCSVSLFPSLEEQGRRPGTKSEAV